MKRIFRGPWLWIVIAVVGVLLALQFLSAGNNGDEVTTSKMQSYITSGEVEKITFVDGDQEIRATLDDGRKVTATWVSGTQVDLVNLVEKEVKAGTIASYTGHVARPSLLGSLLLSLLPIVLVLFLILFLMNNMQGGGGRVMQFAKSKAKLISKDMPKTTFADVAGCEEAIEELGEIKEFLQEPAKFQAVGAKIPKGVLLYGQPGTGKTLLARAVAGEAGVPFYSISGSDFVEMFVGVGASRVRDLFEQAKENAPAIVFIDEIDAVGRHRGAGMGGGHDEREQTLNQLLVEMDGFDVRGGVILIAATNRPDILDPALLRPGRFDRQISVDAPDLAGREQILRVHARGKPMAPDVDLKSVARRTPGFTGADLANVLNEAALLTARQDSKQIDNVCLDEAIDRVIAGPQKRTPPDEREGEADHGLPRGRARPGGRGAPRHRPGAQDHDPAARAGTRLHDGAARRGQVLPDPLRDARQARLHDGRPRGRGDGLPRPDHRCRQRHREGDRAGPGDGHAVRHDRAARGDQARRQQRRAVPGPRHGPHAATTPRTSPPSSTRRPRRSSPRRTRRPSTSWRRTATSSTRWCSSCSRRRRSTRRRSPTIFEPLRRRDRRPAWTGSPDRVPSTIPPVEIPEKVLKAGRQRQRARRREEGGVVLTPPAAGGDSHGERPTGTGDPRRHRDRAPGEHRAGQ